MNAIYLRDMFNRFAVGPLTPVNKEHCQAHAAYVYAACVQALYDGIGYSKEAVESFPFVPEIWEMSEAQLTFWSDRFWTWYCALGQYDRENLQSEICVLTDETSPELLTGRTKVGGAS